MTLPGIPDVSTAPTRRPSDYGKPGMQGTGFQPGMDRQNPPSSFGPGGGGAVTINLSGPWFDGLAPGMVTAMLDEMKYAIAAQVLADWHQNLDRSLQHPTPYYETQITLQQRVDDWVVHDRGIVYGPWLEGTSSRNRTTRFRGYAALRRAVEGVVRTKAQSLVTHVLTEWLRRMN